ncbi:uncharacterized protein LOC129942114 isoform X1 [Eupeodes corollae]|nr:uncharacterized protein LOC129942114 isoform X1 [Eupeodes corollae]XP_055906899.1 uncharacterized protein LOC129942114 isoform X1 [Eupeodes corollae]
MWEILALNLNAMGPITKSIDQWKKCWTDLKSGVRKQCNSRKAFFNRTGGGSIGNAPRDLNEFEEKILAIISTHAVDGDGLTPESGVALNTPIIEMESDECPESQPKKVRKPENSGYKSALEEAKMMQEAFELRFEKLEESNDKIFKQNEKLIQQNEDLKRQNEEIRAQNEHFAAKLNTIFTQNEDILNVFKSV